MRRTALTRSSAAAVYEFLDPSFLHNKRPSVPGGAWPVDLLRKKSIGDLQQIWFQLLRERNMLLSTREHYLKHQEELGAMPAPSRIKMTTDSMANIKTVMKERDNEATDRATAIFRRRLAQGVYRYPPGPPPPPGTGDNTSVVRLVLSKKISEDRLREILGRYDVYESHKGIAKISLDLTPEAWEAKRSAEVGWEHYTSGTSDYAEYNKWSELTSRYDCSSVEVAPGVFEPIDPSDSAIVRAAAVPVPPPADAIAAPIGTVARLRFDARPEYEKTTIQLGYYPNVTTVPPMKPSERPVHPDEIEGPWVVHVTYDTKDGLEYLQGLNLASIDGAEVLVLEDGRPEGPAPYAANCPVFQEALRAEDAAEETLMQWPHVPKWRSGYEIWTKKLVSEIVAYNYSNVVDYVDREVLLTGKSVWESPIEVDYTCGQARSVPVHAEKPTIMFPNAASLVDKRKL